MHCTIQGLQVCILRSKATIAEGPDLKRSYCTDILISTMSDCKILIMRLLCACACTNVPTHTHTPTQEQGCTNTRRKVAMVTFCTVAYLLTVNKRTCFISCCWYLEFWGGSQTFGKFVCPLLLRQQTSDVSEFTPDECKPDCEKADVNEYMTHSCWESGHGKLKTLRFAFTEQALSHTTTYEWWS